MKLEKINNQNYLLPNLKWESVTLYSMYALSILVPLVIGKPQLLVGSVVNFLIVYSTLQYGIKRTLPILILPSLTAATTGLLFEGATYFLLYLTPFIILSNAILSYFISKRTNLNLILAILSKGFFLLAVYWLMTHLVGLSTIFLTSSYLQFVTASIGVLIAVGLYDYSQKK